MAHNLQKELDDLKQAVPDLEAIGLFNSDGLPIAEGSFNPSGANYSWVYGTGAILMRNFEAASEYFKSASEVIIQSSEGDRVTFEKVDDIFTIVAVIGKFTDMERFFALLRQVKTRLHEMLGQLDVEQISRRPGEPLPLKILLLGAAGVRKTTYLMGRSPGWGEIISIDTRISPVWNTGSCSACTGERRYSCVFGILRGKTGGGGFSRPR